MGTRDVRSQWCNRLLLFLMGIEPLLSLYDLKWLIFFKEASVRTKIKKILIGLVIVAVVLAAALSLVAFTGEVAQIDASFTSESKYTGEDIAKAAIIESKLNLEDKGKVDSIEVLAKLNEGINQKVEEIYAEHKAEVKAAASAASTSNASSQPALAATAVNFSGVEAAILNIINTIRVSHGLGALSPNQILTNVARSRSNDMIARGYFSHHNPDGQNVKHILAAHGVSYQNFGENLGQAQPAGYGSPEAFGNAWMNSPSHRANMLKGFYSLIGVGVSDGGGRRVVTVVFIR